MGRLFFKNASSGRNSLGVRRVKLPRNGWRWYVLCLIAPICTGLLRKLLPGQPSSVEVFAVAPIIIYIMLFYESRRQLPSWVAGPLYCWLFFQLMFVFPAIFDDVRVGVVCLLTRIAPMLMTLVAYNSIRTFEDFRQSSRWVSVIAILLLPIGIVAALYGNSILPIFLQPVQKVVEIDRDLRNGFVSPAAVFTTQWIMSWSILSILYLSLANMSIENHGSKLYLFYTASAFASISLLYLSYRRGSLTSGIVGLLVYLAISRNKKSLISFSLIFIVALCFIYLIDNIGYIHGNSVISRSANIFAQDELDPVSRISDVFIPWFTFWVTNAPFGNYLGFAGPEVRGLGVKGYLELSTIVEVGGAQLSAEMGALGALLLPSVVFLLILRIIKRSLTSSHRSAIFMLVSFNVFLFLNYYFKELLALVNPSMGQFFFWAVFGLCAALIKIDKN